MGLLLRAASLPGAELVLPVIAARQVLAPGDRMWSWLRKVGVEAPRGEDFPVMAIWGEKDSMIPVQHAYAAKEIRPDVRLEVLPDVGHFPHAERPALVAELIDDFISAGRSAGPGRSGACQIG